MKDAPDLHFFAILARQPSLAAAAQELGVTPPAVSRRLAQLEQRLGVRLLNRTTRRQSLTPEGERYLEEGGRILRDIEGLERSLAAGADVPHGLLRINASPSIGVPLLPILRCHRPHPTPLFQPTHRHRRWPPCRPRHKHGLIATASASKPTRRTSSRVHRHCARWSAANVPMR